MAGRPKTRDSIKGEILAGMVSQNITAEEMADALKISISTFYRLLKKHTDSWTIGQVRTALKCCGLELNISAKD